MTDIFSMIKRHEGFRDKPYRDTVGKLTIGYGRNLDDVGISEVEAEYLLTSDVSRIIAELSSHLQFWNTLDLARQDALIDMCYNLGLVGLLEFKKMLAAIESGDFKSASSEMLNSRWAIQVGNRAIELAKMMVDGDSSNV